VTDASPQPAEAGPPPLQPMPVDLPRLVLVGTLLWVVALVITLVVPALHRGDRSWWPWSAVCGVLLGAMGLAYLRRGRGNAAGLRTH
jgi:hypothetical protein